MDAIMGIPFFLLLYHSASSLQLTGPSHHEARLGSDALVPCLVTVDNPPVDPEHITIVWFHQDKEILSYDKTVRTTSYRYSLSTEALQFGIAVLTISNIQIHDGGRYKCSVTYRSETKEKMVMLDVGAPPQVKIARKVVVMNKQSVLSCFISGFYPIDIDIRWFRDGERLEENVIVGDPWRNPNRTYNVISNVTITPTEEDRERIFSCTVQQHKSLKEPLWEDFRLVYEVPTEGTSAGIIAACSVLGLMLIILIIGVLWWKLNQRRKGPFLVRDIKGPPKLIDGEETTLYCTVDDYPKNLCVTWLIRRAGQEEEKIQTSQMRGHSEEEKESLLDTSYAIRSQPEGRQYSSSLSFIPHIQRHRDVTFICRGVSHPHKEEKTFHYETVYAKPHMLAPIEITMADSSRVQFSLTLQKFYPKDIRISWHLENLSGKYGLPAEETFTTQDDDPTYDVTSDLWITNISFKDPQIKIVVEWKHESMETSETRELSIRDLPWHPHIGSINVPNLEDGKEATLTCDISGYFPDLLSIIWLTKKDGDLTARPIGSSETDRTYKMSHKDKREDYNTYCCEALLTFTPIISSDQRTEIICRVDHPSLERPIERSSGPLYIGVKRQNSLSLWDEEMDGFELIECLEAEDIEGKPDP
ncbi:uncharacterized protein [Dendropsophus ebraccatus]|uniref:uncharacterized protein isoform X2 n=1 Tax=Dendropsophus ebraccatus TaxID=150705 RepID=UPI003831B328